MNIKMNKIFVVVIVLAVIVAAYFAVMFFFPQNPISSLPQFSVLGSLSSKSSSLGDTANISSEQEQKILDSLQAR